MTVDELYELAPEEFVAARTALAKELRAEGRKDEAAVVAKLRRPSVAAWALNQVARSSPEVVEAAIAAGADLRAASEAAMAGDPGQLRAATAAERAAANAVVKAATEHLGSRAGAQQQALLATIRVAALDDDVADQLRRGVLASEQEQPGFGFGMDDDAPLASVTKLAPRRTAKAKAKAKAAKTTSAPKGTRAAAKDDARAKADADREKAERAAARDAERARKKELTARQRTLDRKSREAKRLAKEADEAEADAREARATADQAQADADAARLAVEELTEPG